MLNEVLKLTKGDFEAPARCLTLDDAKILHLTIMKDNSDLKAINNGVDLLKKIFASFECREAQIRNEVQKVVLLNDTYFTELLTEKNELISELESKLAIMENGKKETTKENID